MLAVPPPVNDPIVKLVSDRIPKCDCDCDPPNEAPKLCVVLCVLLCVTPCTSSCCDTLGATRCPAF